MPAVKLGRDNTSLNMRRLIKGYLETSNFTYDDLMRPAGVSAKCTLVEWMKDPQGTQFRGMMAICKKIGIPREVFLNAIDY